MFKLFALVAFLAVASAAPGYLGAPLAAPYAPLAAPYAPLGVSPWGHGVVSAPLVRSALPVATSYANTVRIASPAVVAAPLGHAGLLAHGPVVASPYAHAW